MPLSVADDEGELFRRGVDGGEDEVALVLAIVVVDDDDDLAASEGAMASATRSLLGHSLVLAQPTWPR